LQLTTAYLLFSTELLYPMPRTFLFIQIMVATGPLLLIIFNRMKRRAHKWRMPYEVRQALDSGLVVVHRKHKRQQMPVGPAIARVDEIFAVIDGELEILAGGKWHPAPPHTFACFPRGIRYGVRQKPAYKGPAQIVNLLFHAPEGWAGELARAPLKLPAPWWRRFIDLEAASDFDAAGQRVAALSEVLAFVERLTRAAAQRPAARQAIESAAQHGPRRPDIGAEWMETWARAEDVIRARASSGLTVDELAAAVNVSPTQLRRVYLSTRGISPKAALTQWRIAEARRLLASGRWNATQVAEKIGFSTLQRFSAVFKTETGENPSEFAKRQ
jgi:AraC-like DNA-binding protein